MTEPNGIQVKVTSDGFLLLGPRLDDIGALEPSEAVQALERGKPIVLQYSGTNMRILVELWAAKQQRR